MKMGIGIGWPNATYQSGEKPLTGLIPASTAFDIQEDSNYTIEFWAGGISPSVSGSKQTFFSFGTNQDLHSAVLVNTGTVAVPIWNFIYYANYTEIFNVDVTAEIQSRPWNFFCIERVANFTWLGFNGFWIYATGAGSPAIPSNGEPMYVGSDNVERVLNGSMNNFRWSNTGVYNTAGGTFPVPNADFNYGMDTLFLTIQGYDLNESLLDQTLNGHNIIKGTNVSYNSSNPFGNNPTYAGNLTFF